jgi:hypothetical protein
MSQLFRCDRFASPLTTARILDVQEGPSINAAGAFIVKVPDNVPIEKPANYADLLTQRALGYLLAYPAFTRIVFDDLLDASAVDMTPTGSSRILLGDRGVITLLPGGVLQSTVVALEMNVLPGTFGVTQDSSAVTSTVDLTHAPTFSQVVFASQPGATYTVTGVTSSGITLGTNYTGVSDAETLAYASYTPVTGPEQAIITWDMHSYADSDPSSGQFTRTYTEEASDLLACQMSFDGTHFNVAYDGTVFNVPAGQTGTSFIIRLTNASGRRLGLSGWTLLF